MNVFVDTCIVDRILDLEANPTDSKWEEDREHLRKLLCGPVAGGNMRLFINPTVISQIEATKDAKRRAELLSTVRRLKFTSFNMTIFPFRFPAKFLSVAQKAAIKHLILTHPALKRDEKILADSAFNETIDVLLTTDRRLASQASQFDKVKTMLPKQLWDFCETHAVG